MSGAVSIPAPVAPVTTIRIWRHYPAVIGVKPNAGPDDSDPLGTADMATHHLPLDEAPAAYAMFQKKQDGCIKVVLHP